MFPSDEPDDERTVKEGSRDEVERQPDAAYYQDHEWIVDA